MTDPIAEASAYLDKFEAERLAAIAISEQKAEEAKLIAARQEIPGGDGAPYRRNVCQQLQVAV